jgi:antitoxin (DNA-binding transcriptional repressor) of toxin-antitoxin stability system
MKTVSLQELKARLSELVAEAAAGGSIVITKHGRSIAQLGAVSRPHLRVGSRVGKGGGLKPFLKISTKGRYLEVLEEDRKDREER